MGQAHHSVININPLIVDGSRAWLYCSWNKNWEGQDFGITNSSPVSLPKSPSLYLDDTNEWDLALSRVMDTGTGRLIFQMGGGHTYPVDVQSGGKYVLVCYDSGEILVLDFNHVFP